MSDRALAAGAEHTVAPNPPLPIAITTIGVMAIAMVGSSISSQLVDLDIAGAFSVSADEASWIACIATMAEVASIPIAAILVRTLSLRTVVLCSASLYALCACMSFFSSRARNPSSCCAQPRVFAAAGVKAHSAVDQATANLAYENQQLVVIDTNEAVAKARVDSGEAALLSAKLALADTAVWAPIERRRQSQGPRRRIRRRRHAHARSSRSPIFGSRPITERPRSAA